MKEKLKGRVPNNSRYFYASVL